MRDVMQAVFDQEIMKAARACVSLPAIAQDIPRYVIDNPLCGDQVTWGWVAQDKPHYVVKVRGCALCQASAFWAYEHMQAHTEIADILAKAQAMLDGKGNAPAPFSAFAPVTLLLARHSCVLLPLQGLVEFMAENSCDHHS
ncbi:MAG: iron-sulfur cluster assembly scaffold protein [Pseudomonadota bacterium]